MVCIYYNESAEHLDAKIRKKLITEPIGLCNEFASSKKRCHIERQIGDPVRFLQISGMQDLGGIHLLRILVSKLLQGSQGVILAGFHFDWGNIMPTADFTLCDQKIDLHSLAYLIT